MNYFVKCTTDHREEVLLNLNAVKLVWRYFNPDRDDIIEDFDGNMYECASLCGTFETSIIPIVPMNESSQEKFPDETTEITDSLAELRDRLEKTNEQLKAISDALYRK